MPGRPSLLAIVALFALLGIAGPAQALPLPVPDGVQRYLAPADGEDDEGEEGEAEASDDEEEEAEGEECEAADEECGEEEGGTEAPPECLLSSLRVTIFASNSGRVRLQVRYASSSPAAIAIAYGLHGAKGALFLGSKEKRLGKTGVLRLDRSLTEAQMVKVMAARDFTVRIRALEAPDRCQSIFDRHLTQRRSAPGGLSWRERE